MYEDIIRKQQSKPHEIAPIMSRLQNKEGSGVLRLVKMQMYLRDRLTGRRNYSACPGAADMFRDQHPNAIVKHCVSVTQDRPANRERKVWSIKTNWRAVSLTLQML